MIIKKLIYGIALTGGIATGKSTVASLLKLYGYQVIDADVIAHHVLEEQKEAIIKHFGTQILDHNHQINRSKLGEIVFEDPKEREHLENIVHPFIAKDIFEKSLNEESKKVPFFVDIPIFFEKPSLFDYLTHSVLIYAPQELQLTRLMKRNSLNQEQATNRINAQMCIEDKKLLASHIIDNTSSLNDLQYSLENYLSTIKDTYGL